MYEEDMYDSRYDDIDIDELTDRLYDERVSEYIDKNNHWPGNKALLEQEI